MAFSNLGRFDQAWCYVAFVQHSAMHMGWQFRSVMMLAMWLASGIHEAFSYVGWQVGLSMKLHGWLVELLRYAPIWAMPGVRHEAM